MTITTVKKAIEAAEHPILLQSTAQLAEAQNAWDQSTILGIDTEFVRERTYRADLGLVQISDGETSWLLDPLSISSLESLEWLFTNPNIVKILHSGSEDLEVLLHSVGALPEPLVDSQVACAMMGQPLQMGYHNACKWLFDVVVDKEQTRSNWCKRPLSERQLHYAAMDVVLLPLMLEKLRNKLQSAGRWPWLEEDVARMLRNARAIIDPDKSYQRFPAAGRLDDCSLRALRALASWREKTADEKNRARGFVISDPGLMHLAKVRPTTLEALRQTEDVHPRAIDRYGRLLLKVIDDARLDQTPIEQNAQLTERQRKQLNEMRQMVQAKAAALAIEPALLASRKELEKLIRAVATGAPLPERFTGWRKEIITDDLLAIVR